MLDLNYYIKNKFDLNEKAASTILAIVNNINGDWELDVDKETNNNKIYLKKNDGSVMVLTNGIKFHIEEHSFINNNIEMINSYSLDLIENKFSIDSILTLHKEDNSITVREHFDNTGRYYYNNNSATILGIIGDNEKLTAAVKPDKIEKPIKRNDLNFIIHFGMASFFTDATVELETLYPSKKTKKTNKKIVKQP